MSFSAVPSGRIVFVREALCKSNFLEAVRLTVRLVEYDPSRDSALFCDACFPDEEIVVDTKLVSPFSFKKNNLYTVIGDIVEGSESRFVKARVIASSEGLDLDLFQKSLAHRRRFLDEEYESSTEVKKPTWSSRTRLHVGESEDEDFGDFEDFQ